MDQNDIADRLYEAAEKPVRQIQFAFEGSAQGFLKDTAYKAAGEIIQVQKCTTYALEGIVRNGEIIFRDIAHESINVTRQKFQGKVIAQSTIRDVILRFCPLWPLC
jgi:hypothetical protein